MKKRSLFLALLLVLMLAFGAAQADNCTNPNHTLFDYMAVLNDCGSTMEYVIYYTCDRGCDTSTLVYTVDAAEITTVKGCMKTAAYSKTVEILGQTVTPVATYSKSAHSFVGNGDMTHSCTNADCDQQGLRCEYNDEPTCFLPQTCTVCGGQSYATDHKLEDFSVSLSPWEGDFDYIIYWYCDHGCGDMLARTIPAANVSKKVEGCTTTYSYSQPTLVCGETINAVGTYTETSHNLVGNGDMTHSCTNPGCDMIDLPCTSRETPTCTTSVTCTECGGSYTDPDCHDLSDEKEFDDYEHWVVCLACGETVREGHAVGGMLYKSASLLDENTALLIAGLDLECGCRGGLASITEIVPLSEMEGTNSPCEGIDLTWTKTYTFGENSASITWNVVAEGAGHVEQPIPDTDPTCTEPGSVGGVQCEVCGETITEPTVIPENGHTEVIDPAVKPTEEAPGLTEGSHCDVCGEVIIPQKEVPFHVHWYRNYAAVGNGRHQGRCSCGLTRSRACVYVSIPLEGQELQVCLVCGDLNGIELPLAEADVKALENTAIPTAGAENVRFALAPVEGVAGILTVSYQSDGSLIHPWGLVSVTVAAEELGDVRIVRLRDGEEVPFTYADGLLTVEADKAEVFLILAK